MKKVLLCSATAVAAMLMMNGCASEPVQIDWGQANQNINNSLLEERYSFVPKDQRLKNTNWAYEIEAQAKDDYLIENNQMVKVFLLAHNASKIIIIGTRSIVAAYRDYFKENGVSAEIDVQPIDLAEGLRDRVKIMFFNSSNREVVEIHDGYRIYR